LQNNFTENKGTIMKLQISCQDLTLGYSQHILAEHLSFTIEKGNYLCIVGENGAGKSTLLNLLNHLETADSGTILFEGRDTGEKGYDVNRMREDIGMVFQSFHLFPHLTVIENIMLSPMDLLGKSKQEAYDENILPHDLLDEILDPMAMTTPGIAGKK